MSDFEQTTDGSDQTTDDSETWHKHFCKVDRHEYNRPDAPDDENEHSREIEPWLTALFQSEHVNLLLGSGFTIAACNESSVSAVDMSETDFDVDFNDRIKEAAAESAERVGRRDSNIEDQFRTAMQLLRGLRIAGNDEKHEALEEALSDEFESFVGAVAETENRLRQKWETDKELAAEVGSLLVSFLMSFATRSPSKERLQVFTTNYDRLIEHACDAAGIRVLDRFVGALSPEFRTTRVDVDMHYNPPGIRGEPRYLEGVMRLTKLHGSIDWRQSNGKIRQERTPFGSQHCLDSIPDDPLDSVIIFPNSLKDIETAAYPYAELFRDFSGSLCRPNAILVTYGYGFGDSHINRIIDEMLQIPSTHLVIISYDLASGRIRDFVNQVGRSDQISLLIGPHFSDIRKLCDHYLPSPNIDRISYKRNELLRRRYEGITPVEADEADNEEPDDNSSEGAQSGETHD